MITRTSVLLFPRCLMTSSWCECVQSCVATLVASNFSRVFYFYFHTLITIGKMFTNLNCWCELFDLVKEYVCHVSQCYHCGIERPLRPPSERHYPWPKGALLPHSMRGPCSLPESGVHGMGWCSFHLVVWRQVAVRKQICSVERNCSYEWRENRILPQLRRNC